MFMLYMFLGRRDEASPLYLRIRSDRPYSPGYGIMAGVLLNTGAGLRLGIQRMGSFPHPP